MLRDRLDESGGTKDLAHSRDADAEIDFLDEAAGPDRLQQFVLADELPAAAHKNEKEIESLPGQRNGLVTAH